MEELSDIRIRTHGRSSENVTGDQRTVLPVFDFAGKTSPCRESCPAGHDISLAMHHVRNGDYERAHRLFLEESPFPSVTGRVCYHPCELVCNRKDYDSAIAINDVERAMAAYGPVQPEACTVTHPDEPVAVVGTGPAGVTAAYHLTRLGYPVTMFEKDELPGGALRYGIPRYRLPGEILDAEFARLTALGVEIRTGVAVGKDMTLDALRADFRAVFLGLGLGKGRTLPSTDAVGAESGLSFLRRVNTGELASLSGDVVVIGGGDVALDVVRSAVRLGATRVLLFCLEARGEMPAHPTEIREAEREGATLNAAWSLEDAARTDDGHLALTFRSVEGLSAGLVPVLGDRRTEMAADHLICAIGQEPDAGWLPQELGSGRIGVDELGATAVPGVFAGGDLAGSYNVVQAIGAGKRAAIGIDSFLRGLNGATALQRARIGGKGAVSMKFYRERDDAGNEDRDAEQSGDGAGEALPVVTFEKINLDYFPEAPRAKAPELSVAQRSAFAEVRGTLSKEEAQREAARCFNCSECTVCGNCFVYCPDSAVIQREDGFFMIDEDHCKGCGQCVLECPRSAMSMVPRRDP